MTDDVKRPWGYRWRSSKIFILSTVTIALFAETFLYGFVVPVLSYMIEVRLQIDRSQTQRLTTALLSIHGFVSLISAPLIGHYAEMSPNRKTPLLMSLGACLAGTILVAYTPSLWALFLGRILQGVAGSAAWIVGLATLADHVASDNMGSTIGLAMSIVGAGTLGGPMAGGALLELVGYWPMWTVPLAVLLLDVAARLIIIEKQQEILLPSHRPSESSMKISSTLSELADPLSRQGTETSPILATFSDTYQSIINEPAHCKPVEIKEGQGFYTIILRNGSVLAGLFQTLVYYCIVASFNATLPLHLREIFGWGSLPVGMLFLALQGPFILLGSTFGKLYDRLGPKYPTTVGWLLMIPLLGFLSVPGEVQFPWASAEIHGPAIVVASVLCIGIALTSVRGAGTLQLNEVVNRLESENPGIFGPNGARSRAFSLAELPVNLGTMVGPLIAGLLSEAVGYSCTNFVLGIMCLIAATLSWRFLTSRDRAQE
ncbi:hypothetical protein PMG11_11109 [Penicillium brasilianum]|uniref:Major facilitator superfamily (MFS) profile domain-containing protein n=1 Tax=Penicillium brasilianum TaxID=104259 RepID=A0A0F7U5A1_PENBI|nr:hypothetical protein PMG11_11109 [Penicillium brasilianum]